jgi:signal transduction histidine kinase
MMALIVAIGLIPLVVGTSLLQQRSRADARRILDTSLTSEASEEAGAFATYFERARAVMLVTAQNPSFQQFYSSGPRNDVIRRNKPLMEEIHGALKELERVYPNRIGEACFIDLGGRENARVVRGVAALPSRLSPNERRNPFFAPTVRLPVGEVYQAAPYVSPDTHQWVISNSTAVTGPGGRTMAMVHFEVTIESFRKEAAAAAYRLYVIDARTGLVVIDSHQPQRLKSALGDPLDRRFLSFAHNERTTGRATISGLRVAYQRLPRQAGNANDWYLVATATPLKASLFGTVGGPPTIMLLIALLVIAVAMTRRWVRLNSDFDRNEENLRRRNIELERTLAAHERSEEALRESEEQLRQSQKMDAIGRLAGGVAHDFNNLLMVIGGNAEVLLLDADADSEVWLSAHEIKDVVARGAGLTAQLLSFSRKQPQTTSVVSLNAIVEDVETMLRRLIGAHVTVRLELEPALCAVDADPVQLQQVLVNLAVNARDAMAQGGSLLISTRNGEVGAAADGIPAGRYVVLEVTDSGVGMDAETQARAFEPFFTTRPGAGTGLGLATVYGIVQQTGGTLSVRSAPGEGTTFTVCLPATAAPADETSSKRAPSYERGNAAGTILLVEDDPRVRTVVSKMLAGAGYGVLEAESAQRALEIAGRAEQEISLLLTDIVMPEMNGIDLAAAFRTLAPQVPIVFMSGYADDPLREQLGTTKEPHLKKPFSGEQLLDAVGGMLNGAVVLA